MSTETVAPSSYPARLESTPPEDLSRGLWLVKWLLIVPHLIVLVFLWIAYLILTVIAFFAILFTAKYPRGIFNFNVGVLRWSWRVSHYSAGAAATDEYPPFTLDEKPGYPANFTVEYPEKLSRGKVLVKWWLLAIPHYIVVSLMLGPQVSYTYDGETKTQTYIGLISILVIIAVVTLLFTGTYPRDIYDLVIGLNRWVYRVAAYSGLMTDEYPPFRLDSGPTEPLPSISQY